jgi:hypothetical protein
MNKIFVFIFVIAKIHFANAADMLPAGIWEGYRQVGSTYQEFVLEIDATGHGYYGFSSNIQKPIPICFTITKVTLLNLISFRRQENKLNGLEFSLTLVPSIDNMFEAINAMTEPAAKKTFSQSWSLVPVEGINRNMRLAEQCKRFLKAHP